MAAPSTAYLNNGSAKLPAKIAGTLQVESLLALNSYGTDAQIKALFFLDILLWVKKHDGLGTTTYAFVGACKVGGANIAHHNTARYFNGRASLKTGSIKEDYVFFNDCGLNTLGNSDLPTVADNSSDNIKIKSKWFSSYFDGSSNYGFEAYTDSSSPSSGTVTIIGFYGTLPANGSDQNFGEYLVTFPAGSALPGITAFFRSFITNPEGTFYSAWKSTVLIKRTAAYRAAANSGNPYQGCLLTGGENLTVYTVHEEINVSDFVWTDSEKTTLAPDGSYCYDGPTFGASSDYFYLVSGQVVSKKRCPEHCEIAFYVEGSKTSPETYDLVVDFGNMSNVDMTITGVVKITEQDQTVHYYDFSVDVLAGSLGIEGPFPLYDSNSDPVTMADVSIAEVISVVLPTYYYESSSPEREVYYTTTIS